jgi:transcriptional regulator of arginine metabolism
VPNAAHLRNERRLAITRILNREVIHRQSELVERLRDEGFEATQSSVSRDLKELGAAKLENGYRLPQRLETEDAASLELVAELVRDVRLAGPHLLVVTTAVGAAQRVAVTLDRAAWPEIVGTLSGDDTVFIATVGATQQRRLSARLRETFRKAAS